MTEEIPVVGDWDKGNDAWPVADGRCCNHCDYSVVVPARMRQRCGAGLTSAPVVCINASPRHGDMEEQT